MTPERPTCDQQIVLRVPAVLRDQLALAAKCERRTLADLTRIVLADWVAARAGSGHAA